MDIDKLEKMYNAGCKEGYQHGYNDAIKNTLIYLENAGYLNEKMDIIRFVIAMKN